MQQVLAMRRRSTLVEGAGGWRVAAGRARPWPTLAVALELPVILVVGVRLGLHQSRGIDRRGLSLSRRPASGGLGGPISSTQQTSRLEENPATLAGSACPLAPGAGAAGRGDPAAVAAHLSLSAL